MTPLAPHLTAFLRDRLPRQQGASPHTCDAYAYAFQLLLAFAAKRLATPPSALALEQLDTSLVLAFLDDLESARGNSVRTRNARLAAIRSFARFVEPAFQVLPGQKLISNVAVDAFEGHVEIAWDENKRQVGAIRPRRVRQGMTA